MDVNNVLEHLVSFRKDLNQLSEEAGVPKQWETDLEKVRDMYVDEFYGRDYPEEERYFLAMDNLFTAVRRCLGRDYYFVDEFAFDEGDGTDGDYWDVYLVKRIVSEQKKPLEKGLYGERVVRAQVLSRDIIDPELDSIDDEDRKIGSVLEKIKRAYDTIEECLASRERG